MYFWNTRALAKDFRKNLVSESEMFKYFIIIAIFKVINSFFLSEHIMYTVNKTTSFLLHVSITILGIIFCYKANQKGDNTNFISRFICLSLPLTIKFIILTNLILYLINLLFVPLFITVQISNNDNILNVFDIIIVIALQVLYYILLRNHILIASGAKAPNN